MRLWHKDLIDVLPRQQLLGQWCELCAIMRNIDAKGAPGHILVNRVMDYPPEHLYSYFALVVDEMTRRGYRCNTSKFTTPHHRVYGLNRKNIPKREIFQGWHNGRYLLQCYYNLQEKHDCGGITDEEWQRVEDRCREVLGRID